MYIQTLRSYVGDSIQSWSYYCRRSLLYKIKRLNDFIGHTERYENSNSAIKGVVNR